MTSNKTDAPSNIQRGLRPKKAAPIIGCAVSTLAKKRCYGGGPKYCKIGRIVTYLPEDLEEWRENLKRSSTSDT